MKPGKPSDEVKKIIGRGLCHVRAVRGMQSYYVKFPEMYEAIKSAIAGEKHIELLKLPVKFPFGIMEQALLKAFPSKYNRYKKSSHLTPTHIRLAKNIIDLNDISQCTDNRQNVVDILRTHKTIYQCSRLGV